MDAETLKEYRYLKREIKSLQKRIDHLNSTLTDRVRASNSEFPYQEIHIQIEGEDPRKSNLELILQERLDACVDKVIEIERFISSIEDSRTRMIFQRRYVDGWSWQKISMSMGSGGEAYARMVHNRFLMRKE
ncbi:hypothetical protein [Aedoeadaptatus acetigenes]|uniref:hypothetical protein n=1 Tax=Aedoeadaptatus acetigenes TaxID=2981723 RepID=UPI0011DE2475|nr:hypothetical protein [Aedoeadaptatus acetigenes]MCU6786399.1 hypothetical protein [Aedoeadaptatus acetigenes]